MKKRTNIEQEQRLPQSQTPKNTVQIQNNIAQPNFIQYAKCLQEMTSVGNLLIAQLLKNNCLINQFMSCHYNLDQNREKSINSIQNHQTQSSRNGLQTLIIPNQGQKSQVRKKSRRHRKMGSSDQQAYQPDVDVEDYDGSYFAPVESKNIAKNYGKAIFYFIESQPKYLSSVLRHLKIAQQQFKQSFQSLKGTINSIADLRSLWIKSQSNHFAKAYRILSMEYLRKRSLGYIYNSRVSKHHKHIKYRNIIMRNMSDPENFTVMKEF